MKRCVGVVDSTHSLRGLCLVDGIISPPIRMPLLHKTLVLLFQLAGACPGRRPMVAYAPAIGSIEGRFNFKVFLR